MKKIGISLCFLVLVIMGISFVSSSFAVNNYSLTTTYYPYNTLSGQMNVSIIQESPDALLYSSFNQSVSIKSLLDNSGIYYSCTPSTCSRLGYSYSNSADSKAITINEYGQEKIFGFVINTSGLPNINSIKFNVSSNYDVSSYIPLVFNISEKKIHEFKNLSTDYTNPRLFSYGCFSFSSGVSNNLQLSSATYCEKIRLLRTTSFRIGVNVSGAGNRIKMSLRSSGSVDLKDCNIEDPSILNSCTINYEIPVDGDYYVCASASESNDYKIYSESSGEKCGWFGSIIDNSSIDYSIFAQVPKYAPATQNMILSLDSLTITDINNYIKDRYSSCSVGCVIPIRVTGIPQTLAINNIVIGYLSFQGLMQDTKIYDLSEVKPKLDFKGILNLSATGFSVFAKGNKTITLSFGGTNLFSKMISVLGAPVISNIYPMDPPAAIPIKFITVVSSDNPVVSYSWSFGDGSTEFTTVNSVYHTYNQLGSYNLKVSVIDSTGVSVSKEVTVIAGSPQEFLNITLARKKSDLVNAINSISSFPSWYQKVIQDKLKIIEIQDSITLIEKDRANAYESGQFLNLSLKINELAVPSFVYFSESSPSMPFVTEAEKINLNPLLGIVGGNIAVEEENGYKQGIIQWQKSNLKASVSKKTVSVIMDSEEIQNILTEYNIGLTSNSEDESYFILQKDLADVNSNPPDLFKKIEGSSYLIVEPGSIKTINFYVLGNEELVMYVSPKLDNIIVVKEIGACNSNYICESEKGENYSNCRIDCKPIFPLVILLIVIILFALIIYTALQMWYKQKYEVYLFKDRKELLNLVMFITNARERGLNDEQIKGELRKKGWSNEKIIYAMKKSRGEKTGMYEIIPVEKVLTYFREIKVKKEIKEKEKPKDKNVLNPKKPLNFGFSQKKNV